MAFKSVINEYYARDISKKVRSAKRIRAMNGEHSARYAPYGYIKSPLDKHKLIIDEESAKVVRMIFDMAADGLGHYVIARRLYQEKVLTPSADTYQRYGIVKGKFDPSCLYDWNPRTIQEMLRSMVYIGHMVNHRQTVKSFKNHKAVNVPKEDWIIVKNTHEPIISVELFEKVQQIIAVKKRGNKRYGSNMFAGLLICADCGRHLTYQSSSGMYGGEGAFNCDGYRHGRRVGADRKCTPHSIGYTALKETVISNINTVISRAVNNTDIFDNILKELQSSLSNNQKPLKKIMQRDNELKILIKKVFEQNALGKISDSSFEDLYDCYHKEQKDVAAKIEDLRTKQILAEKNMDNSERFMSLINELIYITELTRETLLQYIEKIEIHEATGVRGNRLQIIKIHYRFNSVLPSKI